MAVTVETDESVKAKLSASEQKELLRRVRRMVKAIELTEGKSGYDMAVRLVNDKLIKKLNYNYRGYDQATDVLAFAQREGDTAHLAPSLLGDVVISLDTAARQARGSLFDEVMVLLGHGICHLIGYDHQTDEEEREMNARARALLDEASKKGAVTAA